MNQILSTGNNYKQKKPRNSDLLDMRKIIIVFSILIIIFALIIVSAKAYSMIKEKSKNEKNPIVALNKPTINIEQTENICTLKVSYDEGLDKVIYYWDDENIIEKSMNGSTTPFITQIIIPDVEQSVLHVKATGIDGSVNETKQYFTTGEELQDPNKPQISWYYNVENRKIDIIVESNKGIKNLTYQWEGEEEVLVDSTEENQTKLTTTIDAKRGTNEIYITATDTEGNTQVKNIIIVGVIAPEIKVELVNNKTIRINVSHDMGFKKVIMNVNGEELVYDENYPQYSNEITNLNTSIDVAPGTVTVKIVVYTLEEEEKAYTYEASTEISQ